MDEQKQNFRIGLFIIAGVAILLGLLFFFGMSKLFVNDIRIDTVFEESVQGLTSGSAVKYRGVPIGTVSGISIRVSDNLIFVEMKVNLNSFIDTRENRAQQRQEFLKFFQEQLEKGMRCRLEYAGITGMRYVDFDYYSPAGTPPEPPKDLITPLSEKLYIPSVPSSFKDLLKSINVSLEKISKVNFVGISDGVERNLKNMNNLLNSPSITTTLNRVEASSKNLEKTTAVIANVLDEKQFSQLVKLLQEDLEIIHNLGKRLEQDIEKSRLPDSSASFRNAADAVTESKSELNVSLLKLNQTLDSMNELLRSLNEDPGSLLHGKQKPPVKGSRN